MSIRQQLDYDYFVLAILGEQTYQEIADRETERLGTPVSRSLVAGVIRDIKAGKLRPSRFATTSKYIDTYIYGSEPNNGGLPVFLGHPEIEGDAVVINDVHVPFTDFDFAERVIPVAEYFDVDTMIIAGDFLDMSAMGGFKRKVQPPSVYEEMRVARDLLSYYAEYFETIWLYPGNHSDRLLKAFDGGLMWDEFIDILITPEIKDKIIATPYDRITLHSGGETWTIPHQANVSVYSLSVGEQLAWKYSSHVVTTHQHNSAIGMDRYGKYVIIDSGGLHEPAMQPWVQLKTTKSARHDKGFVVIKDGQGKLFTPNPIMTDWSFLEG